MKKLRFIVFILFSFFIHVIWHSTSFAQDQQHIDSLETALKNHDNKKKELRINALSMFDTIATDILIDLAYAYVEKIPSKSVSYAKESLTLSEKIGYKRGMIQAFSCLGNAYNDLGNYTDALINHNACLKVSQEIGFKKGMSGAYNNIGLIYSDQGNYPLALEKFLAALKINEEIGNKSWIAKNYANIGNVYYGQGKYAEALKNQLAALKICEETGDKKAIANHYNNIGVINTAQGNYPEALKNHLTGLKKAEEIDSKMLIAGAYVNIGEAYSFMNNYTDALKNTLVSLSLFDEIGSKHGIAYASINIGYIYTRQKKYKEASAFLTKGLALAKEMKAIEMIRNSYSNMVALDSATGNFKQAFEHHKQFIIYKDSLLNVENTQKTFALQMNYDFNKKQDSLYAVQAKKDLIAANEKNKERLLRNGFIGGFGVMLIFAGIFFQQRNKISKGKKKSDELLLNILPMEVAEELKSKGSAEAQLIDEVTVLFTDFKGFTQLSEKLTPKELVAEINECFSAFDYIMEKHGVEKIKTIGDAYMAAGGLPTANTTHAEDVVNAALAIQSFMQEHKAKKIAANELFFEIRIGVHTGPVVAGIVGVKKFAYDIWGDTVNTASRMESSGEVGKVNISGTTFALVKDKFNCLHRGKIQAKGKGEIDMYFVEAKA